MYLARKLRADDVQLASRWLFTQAGGSPRTDMLRTIAASARRLHALPRLFGELQTAMLARGWGASYAASAIPLKRIGTIGGLDGYISMAYFLSRSGGIRDHRNNDHDAAAELPQPCLMPSLPTAILLWRPLQ